MKTKYLDNEIELLNSIKRNNEISDYGQEKLSEFNEIKKQLSLPDVVVPKGTLCDLDGKKVMVKFKVTKYIPKIFIEDI